MRLSSVLIVAGLVLLAFSGGVYVGSPNLYKVMPTKRVLYLKYCDPIPVDSLKQPDHQDI